MAVATRLFFDMMHENTTKIILFGDACFNVTGPLVQISKWWNMTQLSYADTNPLLSDRKEYENFYRTVPSDSDFNPARLALLRKFKWKRVGTIYQDTSEHAQSNNKLVSLLERNNISVSKEGSFADDADTALKKLQESEIRIIIGIFSSSVAPNVFCNAYKRGMYGEKYQWIIMGGYPDDWWRKFDENCTRDQLNETIHGYIATDILPLSSSNQVTDSGWTSAEYLEKYNELRGTEYSKFHGYAFDGIWVIAKAFDLLTRRRKRRASSLSFTTEEVRAALNATDFLGVTGVVRFHNGDRVGGILFEQFQGGMMVKIGEYAQHEDHLNLSMENKIIWRGAKPPRDGYVRIEEMQRLSILAFVIFSSLAVLGIILACGFLAFNIKFRKHRYIKMSSPNMNNMIVMGCILTYVSVFLLGTDGRVLSHSTFAFMCNARAWVLSVGFTLAFGAMFSKTWRVHAIFTNIKMNKKVIKDYKLFLIVGVLLVVDGVMLGTWWGMDPFHIASKELSHSIEGDYEIVPIVESCASEYMTIWMGLIYAYKGLLLVIGCFLAWETRHVSIPALNDSKYIGMSVYNVVIMCTCGAAVSIIIKDQPTSAFIIIGLFIIFSTTITLCLLFVPKIIELRRDPKGDERSRVRATLKKPSSKQNSVEPPHSELHQKLTLVNDENIRYKELLEAKNKAIEELMEQLGEEASVYEASIKTPVHKMVEALRTTDTSPSRYSRIPWALPLIGHAPLGTITSDGDTTSMISDLSAATSIWQVDSPSGQRIYLHLRSMGEDTSCTESIELVDFSSKPTFTKLTPMTEEYLQRDQYNEDYATMFYARSSADRTSQKNHIDPNEPAELPVLPAKEEHPLVQRYAHITFLDANGGQDDESTDSMPMESARRDLADEQRSIISGDMPELEDSDDEGTLIEYEDCEWTDRRLSESTTSWHDTLSGGGGLDDYDDDGGSSSGGGDQVFQKQKSVEEEEEEDGEDNHSVSSGSAEKLIPPSTPPEHLRSGRQSPALLEHRHHLRRHKHRRRHHHHHYRRHHQHEHLRYADAEDDDDDSDDDEFYYDEKDAEEPIVPGATTATTRSIDLGSPCCSSCSNSSSSSSSSYNSSSSNGSSPCYIQTVASFENDSTSPEMAASPVTVVAVSSNTCCDDTSISSSNSNSNNNNNSNFNNNNNNNSNNNNNNNSHNVGSSGSGSSSGSYGRAQARCNEPDPSTIQTKAASTAAAAAPAASSSVAAAACVAPEVKTWPSSQGKQTTENNNDLGLGSASTGTKDLSRYGEASLAEIEADPTTDVGGQSQKPPTEVSGTGVGGRPATIAGPAVCNNDVKDEESDDEQQEIFVDALLNPTNPVPLPSTRVVRPMLTCDIIERV